MNATAVIVVEGVLKSATGEGVIDSGTRLYHGLKSTSNVALLSTDEDTEYIDRWLRLNGFNDHAYLFGVDRTLEPYEPTRRLKQVARLRESGAHVQFVVEPDPSVAAALLQHGIPTLVAAHPRYSLPQFRPDFQAQVTPWDELATEVDRQREMRARDDRLERDAL